METTFRPNYDAVADSFEGHWQSGGCPSIDDFLPRVSIEQRADLLLDLVRLELEYRLRRGESTSVEDWLARYPYLQADRHTVVELISLEYRVRRLCNQKVNVPDYLQRFPQYRRELSSILQDDDTIPPQVPGYVLDEELGRGGMGIVFRARDSEFARPVAIKVIRSSETCRSTDIQRFIREAQITGRLEHPGIPAAHRLGTLPDGRPFLAMKLVQGQTFAEVLAQNNLSEVERGKALHLFEQICQTVAFAHSKGVVHRDLKPSNVMIGAAGEVQVMDWGLAKVLGDSDVESAESATTANSLNLETQPGDIMGTPAYMSPEQARGEHDRVDARTDVFALGAILCQILTGRIPYEPPILESAQRASLDGARQRLMACDADRDLVALALRCLASDPGDRPANAAEVAQAVANHRLELERRLREADRAFAAAEAKSLEERKRRRVQYGLVAAIMLSLLVGGAFAWYAERKAETDRSERASRAAAARTAIELAQDQVEKSLRADKIEEATIALKQAERRLEDDAARDDGLMQTRQVALSRQVSMLEELNRIWDSQATTLGGAFDVSFARRDLPRVFQEHQIDWKEKGATVERLKDSPIREQILGALDLWLFVEPKQAGLLELLAALDTDADRNAWRASVASAKKDQQRIAAERMSNKEQPPRFLAAFGEYFPIDQGKKLLRSGWNKSPKSLPLTFALARFLSRGTVIEKEEAIGYYRAAISLNPGHSPSLINLAVRLNARGEFDEALVNLNKAIAATPERPEGHYNLGVLMHSRGMRKEAVAAFRAAIKAEPKFGRAYTNLGAVLLETNDIAGAVDASRKALEIDPKNTYALNNLGRLLKQKGDLEGAVINFKKALELDPEDVTTLCDLGLCMRSLGNFPEALKALERADTFDKGQSSVPIQGLIQTTREMQALFILLPDVLQENGERVSLQQHINLARVCHEIRRYTDTVRLYTQILGRNPTAIPRFAIAHAAVRAANGEGVNPPTPTERPALRRQALEWLRSDLATFEKAIANQPFFIKQEVKKMLEKWLSSPDLASVRDADELAKLTKGEQQEWNAFWTDVRRVIGSIR